MYVWTCKRCAPDILATSKIRPFTPKLLQLVILCKFLFQLSVLRFFLRPNFALKSPTEMFVLIHIVQSIIIFIVNWGIHIQYSPATSASNYVQHPVTKKLRSRKSLYYCLMYKKVHPLNEILISFSIEKCVGPILCRFSAIFVAN